MKILITVGVPPLVLDDKVVKPNTFKKKNVDTNVGM